MQIFEFHFNPPKQKEVVSGHAKSLFDSFCYEPENIYEKRMGSLYMVGFLKNVLPQSAHFLNKLSRIIKEKYYKTISASQEKSLKEALRKANEHLEKTAKEGDVSWLGNLDFAVLSLKNFELNFAKTGFLKIFLLRKGRVIDIDQRLKFDDIEPFPLKIFGNIVSGRLAENDAILVLTKEIFENFQIHNLVNQVAKIFPFEQKKLKELLNGKREELTKLSGIFFLVVLRKESVAKERETLFKEKTLKIFSFKEIFKPIINLFKKAIRVPHLKIPQLKLAKPKIRIVKPVLPKLPKIRIKIPLFFANKKLLLIISLILILALGFFIFERKEQKQLTIYRENLNQIEQKINQAQSYLLITGNNPQARISANLLFNEGWQEISPLVNIASTFPSDLASRVLQLKNKISDNLYLLNQLVNVLDPEIIFEFTPHQKNIGGGFIPQRLISFGGNLYFFSPYSENAFKVNQNGEGGILSVNKKFNFAYPLPDSILFFTKPKEATLLKDGNFSESINLATPYANFNFNDLSSFQGSLYLSDIRDGKIIKYPYLGNYQWGEPRLWLANEKAKDFKSLAVDGSLWALTKKNSIERYYAGKLQETWDLDIFPAPKYFSKIFTSSQLFYLYLLEPDQRRIVILNRSGEIVKQFQSEKFNNLLDFSVSENGKTIYLLNGLKVYKVTL